MIMFPVSEQDLPKHKAAHQAAFPAAAPAVKIWRLFHFNTCQDAVNFANVPPVQVAGEFGMTDDPAERGVCGYYFF